MQRADKPCLRRPLDLATRETAGFIVAWVPSGGSILEVGCGKGEVALELGARGYIVTGVEMDPASACIARDSGVRIIERRWPNVETQPADAIVFTRSLHHINPLEFAVRRAREIVNPGGRIVLEDFEHGEPDEASVAWLLNQAEELTSRGLLLDIPEQTVTLLRKAPDPMRVFHGDHEHELHDFETMRATLAGEFTLLESLCVPYLYRYLVPVMPETPAAAAELEKILEQEMAQGAAGRIRLIGRRLVGVPSAA